MNPRLVEPGFAVVCLHADVPARPGKDQDRQDEAQAARQHGFRQNTGTAGRCARAGIASMARPKDPARLPALARAPYTLRGIWSRALLGALLIALACGCQAAFAPTVRVSCPARTSAAPDCDLRWLVAFDKVPIRHTPLPALQPVGEIVQTAPTRRGGATTLYLNTSAGPVRTIMWGDQLSLQRDLRDPLRSYFENAHAPAIELTMRPSWWTDPGGTADNRLVRRPHPIRVVANAIVVVGLLFWIWLPVQVVMFVAGRNRA